MREGCADRHRRPDSAFCEFYDAAVADVYSYFNRATVGDRALAEDLTQETFMAAVKAHQNGQTDAFTMPWVVAVARNKLIDHYRKRSREERKLALVRNSKNTTAFAVTLEDLSKCEALELLRRVPDRYRVILVLRYLDDLPIADIARLIGRELGATQSLLIRARQSLGQVWSESHDG